MKNQTDKEPEIFAGYTIEDTLGQGEHAIVYKGRKGSYTRAIKTPLQDISDKVRWKVFIAGQIALQLPEHPNIIKAVDDGIDEKTGRYYAVFDYIEGSRDLAEIIREQEREKKTPTEKEVCRLGVQIAQALELAHAQDVIHGDVKPGNIIMCPGGIAKLTDFLIGRRGKKKEDLERYRKYFGYGLEDEHVPESTQSVTNDELQDRTEGYGHNYIKPPDTNLSVQTDIYQLGFTLFMYGTNGKQPGEDRDVFKTEELDGIMRKCFTTNLTQRYQNCSALISDLRSRLPNPGREYKQKIDFVLKQRGEYLSHEQITTLSALRKKAKEECDTEGMPEAYTDLVNHLRRANEEDREHMYQIVERYNKEISAAGGRDKVSEQKREEIIAVTAMMEKSLKAWKSFFRE